MEKGRRNIYNRKKNYEKLLNRFKKDKSVISQNKKLILKFLEDCEKGKTLRNRQKKKIKLIN